MDHRSHRRALVWEQMLRLEKAGLGKRDEVSPQRDKFLLNQDLAALSQVTRLPTADGHIQSTKNALLFRDAASPFVDRLPEGLRQRAVPSRLGLEFRWTKLQDVDIRVLFDTFLAAVGMGDARQDTSSLGHDRSAPSQPTSADSGAQELEGLLVHLAGKACGGFPIPWMTNLDDPSKANVLVVGQKQMRTYEDGERLGLQRYLDAQFNRNGRSCRDLYDEMSHRRPSPTRRNLDFLSRRIAEIAPEARLLETNVVCYLEAADPKERRVLRGRGDTDDGEVFLTLLAVAQPEVVIFYGAGAVDLAQRYLNGLPRLVIPYGPNEIHAVEASLDPLGRTFRPKIIVLPTLSPPEFSKWQSWWPAAAEHVAVVISNLL